MKLGLTLNSLKLDVKEAIGHASKKGVKTIDVDATRGEVTAAMSSSGRRDFARYVNSFGLEIAALGGDFGRTFSDENAVERLFELTERLIGLATDLKVRVITTRIGRVPADENGREWAALHDVLEEIGKHAERYEISLATHLGESRPTDAKRMLDSLGTRGIKVCYDASVLIPDGLDAVQSVYELSDYIAHAYARDVLRGEGGYAEAVPGDGIVPFKDYLLALLEIGYQGSCAIKREAGEGTIEDLIRARKFLEGVVRL
ncbi:MAG: sugar phosphate isomerase/epimerase family protein [Planctomycetota bacterium]